MIGTVIDGKYLVKRQLGAGAMGAVYEAEHTTTGRRVAVKVISAGDLTRDPQMLARFQREARAAGAIDTQHITQVLDAGFDPQSQMPYLVMEFLSGEDLQQVIKRVGPLSPEVALRITAQACLGLQKAHETQVVHRDIKPANLFLAKRDAGEMIVKLLDFGIAKVKMEQAQEVESAGLTKTGSMLGSPLFMSPEQARGIKDIDHRTDLWSLGVVLYQALCGRTPYQHVTSLGQLILAICNEWPPPVQQFAPWVPQDVAAIVHRALRHDPNERFGSAVEMFAAIRQLLPGGWGLTEDMILPLDQSARDLVGLVAPRLSLPGQAGAASAGPGMMGTGTGGTAPGMTMPRAAMGMAAPGSASKAPAVAALGVLALAGLASVAYVMTRPAPGRAIAPTTTEAPAPTSAPTTAPEPSASAAATTAPPDPAPRRVQVAVTPPDVQAEIDGEKAQVQGGVLQIKGKLGGLYRVKISKGGVSKEQDVAITEVGANPIRIDLFQVAPKDGGKTKIQGMADKFTEQ